MHVLARNKQDLWYANPVTVGMAVDENGFRTGEPEITYGEPVKVRMSMAISSGANNLGSQGMAELERYGITTGYTHRAVTDDLTCPMCEESLVWFGILPEEEVDGEVVKHPHNFKIVRRAKSLNHLIFFLKEVDVGEN